MFDEWDEDGNGTLNRREFHRMVRLLGQQHVVREDVDAVFEAVDYAGNGAVGFDEMKRALNAWGRRQHPSPRQHSSSPHQHSSSPRQHSSSPRQRPPGATSMLSGLSSPPSSPQRPSTAAPSPTVWPNVAHKVRSMHMDAHAHAHAHAHAPHGPTWPTRLSSMHMDAHAHAYDRHQWPNVAHKAELDAAATEAFADEMHMYTCTSAHVYTMHMHSVHMHSVHMHMRRCSMLPPPRSLWA